MHMSSRDQRSWDEFAAAAMSGLITRGLTQEVVIMEAGEYAEKMLIERERRTEKWLATPFALLTCQV